ncbi:DNA/RNA nuclease SfsA [Salirhabdus salicampi]|uniref:DNA/RNA nuclease SfsA n=1 Tax=Salirhabdus salicampi TaxID=476102 RepID=UPI0020C31ADB|nr:DNA/RNA nuclease SfsA [Salirhabdus salicampi]MCP8616104.1 DNA/RNA nuclease SfsA [Salirhabdus salicampi]
MFIPFQDQLYETVFIERVNRFILSCKLSSNGEVITVHLPDPGRLKELLVKGNIVYVSYHEVPHRKTKWTAQLVKKRDADRLVSLRSTLPNGLIEEALKQKKLPEFEPYSFVQREFTYGGSRWDFLLENNKAPYLLEVKSVTMEKDGKGYFPDAPTKRGTKHVKHLTKITREGIYKTGILFVCQRSDIDEVRVADWIDLQFAEALGQARETGVDVYARSCYISLEGITLNQPVPVQLT